MKIYEAVVYNWYEGKKTTDSSLVPGNSYAEAAGAIEEYWGEDLISFSIRELDTPVLLDKELLDYWHLHLDETEGE